MVEKRGRKEKMVVEGGDWWRKLEGKRKKIT